MSSIKIEEDAKFALGKMVIGAALDDAKRAELESDPVGKLNSIPGVTVPSGLTIEILQNTNNHEFLVLPNREMVEEQKRAIDGGEDYSFPGTYCPPPADAKEKYNYRVGDYVLAQCG